MRRKYIIEAGVAGLSLIILFIVMVPRFQRAQVKAQVAAMAQCVNDLVARIASEEKQVIRAIQINTRHLFHCYGSQIVSENELDLGYLSYNNVMPDPVKFIEEVGDVDDPNWQLSDWRIVVYKGLIRHNNVMIKHPSAIHYSYVSVSCIVGPWEINTGRKLCPQFKIDERGQIVFDPAIIPYDSSNGLTSYGEWQQTSESFWPLPSVSEIIQATKS